MALFFPKPKLSRLLLKKLGKVVTADEKRSVSKKKSVAEKKASVGKVDPHLPKAEEKQTATP